MTYDRPPASLSRAVRRELELATYLAGRHGAAHNLCASECEPMRLAELLGLADEADTRDWADQALGYTDPHGDPALREAIAARYTILSTQDLAVFGGAQEAIFATIDTLLGAQDHAIVVVPGYQSAETLTLERCAATAVVLDEARGWALDLDQVADAIRPQTRAVLISFPNNPTGKLLDSGCFSSLVSLCRRHGLWLVSDEAYRWTEHAPGDTLPAAGDCYERGITISGTSKALGLPGLRVGWVGCQDRQLVARLRQARQYLSGCTPGPSEILARIALKAAPAILARNHVIFRANLPLLAGFFARHEDLFTFAAPEAGVVCFPRYNGADGVDRFAARLLTEAGVLLAPASLFRSELAAIPMDRFRLGFGRLGVAEGLTAFEAFLESKKGLLF